MRAHEPGQRPPLGLEWRSSKWFICFTVSFAVFTDIFLYSLIIPVIPFSLQERVAIDGGDVARWVSVLIAVYGGALAACSPLVGWIADHTKTRQAPFMIGLLALAGGTLMLHIGRSIPVLVLGRVVQGASASVVWIVGLALLADTVASAEIGQYMGYVFIATSLGVFFGPLLGGIVFDRASYNVVFAMAYASIGIDIILRLIVIEKRTALRWLPESIIAGEISSSVEAPESGEAAADKEMDAAVNAEQLETENEPSVKKRPAMVTLLRSKRLLASLWGTTVVAILVTAFEATLPIYTEEIWSYNSIGAALLLLAITIPSLVSPAVGVLADKVGAKWPATIGFILLVPVEVCLRFVYYNTIEQKVLLVALLVLFGLWLNLIMTPLLAEITHVVQVKVDKTPEIFGKTGAYAQAYGLFNFSYALGSLLGPIWGGFVRDAAGWGTMGWTLGLISAVSAVPTAIWCGGSIYAKHNQ